MAKDSDDPFGGFFDFDGNGHTDVGEEFIGYHLILGESLGDDDDGRDSSECGGSRTSHTRYTGTSSTNKREHSLPHREMKSFLKRAKEAARPLYPRIIIVCAVCAIVVLACLLLHHVDSVYDEALDQFGQGKVLQARETLRTMKGTWYRDTKALLVVCDAYDAMRAGDYETAQALMDGLEWGFDDDKVRDELEHLELVLRKNTHSLQDVWNSRTG